MKRAKAERAGRAHFHRKADWLTGEHRLHPADVADRRGGARSFGVVARERLAVAAQRLSAICGSCACDKASPSRSAQLRPASTSRCSSAAWSTSGTLPGVVPIMKWMRASTELVQMGRLGNERPGERLRQNRAHPTADRRAVAVARHVDEAAYKAAELIGAQK